MNSSSPPRLRSGAANEPDRSASSVPSRIDWSITRRNGLHLVLARVYDLSLPARIQAVSDGIPAEFIGALGEKLGISRRELADLLGIPKTTFFRRLAEGGRLTPQESEPVVDLVRLCAAADASSPRSAPARQAAIRAMFNWLSRAHPELEGKAPRSLMAIGAGRELVLRMFLRETLKTRPR